MQWTEDEISEPENAHEPKEPLSEQQIKDESEENRESQEEDPVQEDDSHINQENSTQNQQFQEPTEDQSQENIEEVKSEKSKSESEEEDNWAWSEQSQPEKVEDEKKSEKSEEEVVETNWGWGNTKDEAEGSNGSEQEEEGFAPFTDAIPQQTLEQPQPQLEEEEADEDGFDNFEEAPVVQSSPTKEQNEEDGFDDFDEPVSAPTVEVASSPSILQASPIKVQSTAPMRDPSKINTLFDLYPNREDILNNLKIKEVSPSYQSRITKFEMPKVDSQSRSLNQMTFAMKIKSTHQSNKSKPDIKEYVEAFDTFKDLATGKSNLLIGLKDWKISSQDKKDQDTFQSDNTTKFAVGKKEKKASELLMQMQFNSIDMSTSQLQPFEIRIQQESKIEQGRNVFKEQAAKRFKIQLPTQHLKPQRTQLQTQESGNNTSAQRKVEHQLHEQSSDLQLSQMNHESKESYMQENKGGQYGEEGQLDVDFEEYDNAHNQEMMRQSSEDQNNSEQNESPNQVQTGPQNQVEKTDFVKDTFAKFGLSMNLYTADGGISDFNANKSQNQEKKPGERRIKAFLDRLPDYKYLLDSKLSLPQTFFASE